MSLTIAESSSATFELPPAGPQAARCSRVIDLGTQQSEFNGETKSARKLLLTWQLAELRTDGEPFQVSRRFTTSLHKKSALRAFLESWRGRPFTPEELTGFDMSKLINAPCLLNLMHVQRGEKDYANILGVSPLPKGMQPPPPVIAPVIFSMSDPTCGEDLPLLPQRLREQIEASPEWRELTRRAAPAAQAGAAGSGFDDMDSDIPF
jgi:hypothetical protein